MNIIWLCKECDKDDACSLSIQYDDAPRSDEPKSCPFNVKDVPKWVRLRYGH